MKIALGTVQWGLFYGISNSHGIPTDKELVSILTLAKKNNINLLDTAANYGDSEKRLGKFATSGNKIITKIGYFTKAHSLENQIEKSFKNLRRERIYGCLFHNGDDLIKNEFLWGKILQIKKSGRIKKIGYSIYEPSTLLSLLKAGMIPDIVQVPYSILDRKFENYFSLLKKKNIEIHVRSIFLQGLYFLKIEQIDSKYEDLKKPLELIQILAEENNFSILELALCFVLQNNHIDYVVSGVENEHQLKQIINASTRKLPLKIIRKIKALKLKNQKMLNPSNWK